jgi:hypothetical protein
MVISIFRFQLSHIVKVLDRQLDLRVHMTPYQSASPLRPWIAQEYAEFHSTMGELGRPLQLHTYVQSSSYRKALSRLIYIYIYIDIGTLPMTQLRPCNNTLCLSPIFTRKKTPIADHDDPPPPHRMNATAISNDNPRSQHC